MKIMVAIDCSAEEKENAKRLAKSKGMTFQGWLGQLIKRELANSTSQIPPSQSLSVSNPEKGESVFSSGGNR